MNLRLQVQRKLEAERIRAMERLRHAEAGKKNSIIVILIYQLDLGYYQFNWIYQC